MSKIKVSKADKNIEGIITLSGSKSISNRVLIIQALCEESFEIQNLSDSDDTRTLQSLLTSDSFELDAHHAGTTFRFLTSYLAIKEGEQVLTGSSRMKERPIKALVEALNHLGADIEYLENEGYPPLKIKRPSKAFKSKIELPADISSQYISSLLLVAPYLEKGLEIKLIGEIVSRPYLEMTLRIMEYFGVHHSWEEDVIQVKPQKYKAKDFYVEADWSAASYYYIMGALADGLDLRLKGLNEKSLQGDSAIVDIGKSFGIKTSFDSNEILLKKSGDEVVNHFEYNFLKCPDIAQSVSTMCAGLGVTGLFSGLQTLRIKETDRIAALQIELGKVSAFLSRLPDKFSKKSEVKYYIQEGKAETEAVPTFATYKDHRMAMAFAPLAMLFPIEVEDHMVVSKSYPNFWKDLASLGYIIEVNS